MKSKSFLKAAEKNFNGKYDSYELNDEEFMFYNDYFLTSNYYEDWEEARTLALLLCIQLIKNK